MNSVVFSVEFKVGNKQSLANPTEAPSEESNESLESEKTGHIKTVFKQLFKCEFRITFFPNLIELYVVYILVTYTSCGYFLQFSIFES